MTRYKVEVSANKGVYGVTVTALTNGVRTERRFEAKTKEELHQKISAEFPDLEKKELGSKPSKEKKAG